MTAVELSDSELESRLQNLLGLLSTQERANFLASAYVSAYEKNETIYSEGESPDFLLCLLDGKVKIYRDGVVGRSQIIRLLQPGQYFGYRASLALEPYVTAAAAFEPALVCAIPMQAVKDALAENNALCRFFIRELAVDLGIADSRTVNLMQKHVRGRLAESLLFLKKTYGVESDGQTLAIRLTREDLAGLSNMAACNAIRTLSSFAAEGLISVAGRTITLLDEGKLRRISRMG